MGMRNKQIVETIPRAPRPKHRFDKQIITVVQTTNANSANTGVTAVASFPYVFMGLIVQGGSSTLVGVNVPFIWVISVVPQGTALSAIGTGNGNQTYTPEQMVLAFGSGSINSGCGATFNIKTKTGRKINVGDQVFFQVASTTANAVSHVYAVQFFFKT